jgi:hypothetical protein
VAVQDFEDSILFLGVRRSQVVQWIALKSDGDVMVLMFR